MKKRFKKITKRNGFLKYFREVMGTDEEYLNLTCIPFLNIIVAIIMIIVFIPILLIYLIKGEETYYEEIALRN